MGGGGILAIGPSLMASGVLMIWVMIAVAMELRTSGQLRRARRPIAPEAAKRPADLD